MSYRDNLKAAPGRHDMLRVLRELERANPHKPRISDSNTIAEEVVALAQDPYLAFPDSNLDSVDETKRDILRLHTKFLGFFGPQGALPLITTAEVFGWWYQRRDDSFARFADVFGNRFQQLFFRAWSDAHPISQFDRPKQDRFYSYVGSFVGIGTPAHRDRDDVADIAKLPYAGLASSRIKSRRLAQLIRGAFKLDATVIERVGSWLQFEPSDQMAVGSQGSSLGLDAFLGAMVYSINDKFRVAIRTTSLEQYSSLLPSSPMADKLADLIFFYVGHRYEYDVELSLPAPLAPPTRLGASGQLGWTSWIAPVKGPEADDTYLNDARFNLSERRRAALAAKGTKQGTKAGTK